MTRFLSRPFWAWDECWKPISRGCLSKQGTSLRLTFPILVKVGEGWGQWDHVWGMSIFKDPIFYILVGVFFPLKNIFQPTHSFILRINCQANNISNLEILLISNYSCQNGRALWTSSQTWKSLPSKSIKWNIFRDMWLII